MKTEPLLKNLIQSLREELLAYGEFLARWEELRRSEPAELPARTRALQAQQQVLRRCQQGCAQLQGFLAQGLGLPPQTSAPQLLQHLPAGGHAVLLRALVEENEALSKRVELGLS